MTSNRKKLLANGLFIAGSLVILGVLLDAPPETTKPLPHDQNHERFMAMDKKEAERFCEQCHAPGKQVPLPANHPPPNRCLFCHKRK
ncbi:MAG: hypothetical protein LBD10_03280 [Desulfobulbus sp.]|jgi:hypothetical protein|uniref:hypothetical protein n=1 Tax=Desulfobulbus sp. TaxID=895 RepID=UPI002849A9C5|nr:hypothetical protein [Desulfobulbus sp.]MDR2549211.1 hypothetical protein [Desulfobulbus sp.]